jgi:hypothetical protein
MPGMNTQPVALDDLQDIDDFRVDSEPDSETVESFGAIRGVLFAMALCVPFWAWVVWLLF